MIVRHQDKTEQAASEVRGGVGQVFSRLLVKGEGRSALTALALNRIPAGCHWGETVHRAAEEFFFIVEGTASVLDRGAWQELGPGDLLYTLPGKELAIRNTGSGDLVFLAGMIKQPQGFFR